MSNIGSSELQKHSPEKESLGSAMSNDSEDDLQSHAADDEGDYDSEIEEAGYLENAEPKVLDNKEYSKFLGDFSVDDVINKPIELGINKLRNEIESQILGVFCGSGLFFQELMSASELEVAFNDLSNFSPAAENRSSLEELMEKYLTDKNLLASCMKDKTKFFKLDIFKNVMDFDTLLGKFRPLVKGSKLQSLKNTAETVRRAKLMKKIQKYEEREKEFEDPVKVQLRMDACNLLMELTAHACNEQNAKEANYSFIKNVYDNMSQKHSKAYESYLRYKEKLQLDKFPLLDKKTSKALFGSSSIKKWLDNAIFSEKIGCVITDAIIMIFIKNKEKYTTSDLKDIEAKADQTKEERYKNTEKLLQTFDSRAFFMAGVAERKANTIHEKKEEKRKFVPTVLTEPVLTDQTGEPSNPHIQTKPNPTEEDNFSDSGEDNDKDLRAANHSSCSVPNAAIKMNPNNDPIIYSEQDIGEREGFDVNVPLETKDEKLTRLNEFSANVAVNCEHEVDGEPVFSNIVRKGVRKVIGTTESNVMARPQMPNEPNPIQLQMLEEEKQKLRLQQDYEREQEKIKREEERAEREQKEKQEKLRVEQKQKKEESAAEEKRKMKVDQERNKAIRGTREKVNQEEEYANAPSWSLDKTARPRHSEESKSGHLSNRENRDDNRTNFEENRRDRSERQENREQPFYEKRSSTQISGRNYENRQDSRRMESLYGQFQQRQADFDQRGYPQQPARFDNQYSTYNTQPVVFLPPQNDSCYENPMFQNNSQNHGLNQQYQSHPFPPPYIPEINQQPTQYSRYPVCQPGPSYRENIRISPNTPIGKRDDFKRNLEAQKARDERVREEYCNLEKYTDKQAFFKTFVTQVAYSHFVNENYPDNWMPWSKLGDEITSSTWNDPARIFDRNDWWVAICKETSLEYKVDGVELWFRYNDQKK